MDEADHEMVYVLLRALHLRRAATSEHTGGELWVHEDGTRITLTWGNQAQWGVMFKDGSVRHPWNGYTAQRRAEEEAARLYREHPGDTFVVVHRRGSEDWRLP